MYLFIYSQRLGDDMSIFPFMQIDVEAVDHSTNEVPLPKEFAYDFEKNELKLDQTGNTYLVAGNEALQIWIYKALQTARYNYIAYSEDFGSETHTLIGSARSYEITQSEIQRYITEALYFNNYIKEIKNFVFTKLDAGVQVEFEVVTIYGSINMVYQEGGG